MVAKKMDFSRFGVIFKFYVALLSAMPYFAYSFKFHIVKNNNTESSILKKQQHIYGG